jgi:hypothetical protein
VDTLPALADQLQKAAIGWACFGAASVAAIVLIGVEANGTTFSGDDWAYLYRLANQSLPSAMFDSPPGTYLVALPMLVYAALAELFGIDSYVPHRIAGLLLLVLAAGLLLEWARRRVGYAAALPGAVLMLFFGAASEVVVIPMRFPSQLAICAGLAMLLALDRKDSRGDVAAFVLAAVALLSHPVALGFVAVAVVRVALEVPDRRRRRSWMLLPPVLYGIWLAALHPSPETGYESRPSDVVSFAADYFVAVSGALSGVFESPWTDGPDFINGWSTAIAIFAVAALAIGVIAIARAGTLPGGLMAALAGLAVGLISPAFSPAGLLRVPDAPRYLYPGAIFVLLVVVELVKAYPLGGRARPLAAGLAALVFISALTANVALLEKRASTTVDASRVLKAELGALEFTRGGQDSAARVGGGRPAEEDGLAHLIFAVNPMGNDPQLLADAAPAFFLISDAYGSPAYGTSALRAAPVPLRQEADRVLAAAIPIELSAVERASARSGNPPTVHERYGNRAVVRGSCLVLLPGPESSAAPSTPPLPEGDAPPLVQLSVPPGELRIQARGNTRPALRVGRLSGQPIYPITWPSGERAASLSLPRAGLGTMPWSLVVYSDRQTKVCARRPPNR